MTACTSLALLFVLVLAGFSVCRIFYPEGWHSANAALVADVHEMVADNEDEARNDRHNDCISCCETCPEA